MERVCLASQLRPLEKGKGQSNKTNTKYEIIWGISAKETTVLEQEEVL